MNGSIKLNPSAKKWDFAFNIAKDTVTGARKQIRRRGFSTKREASQSMAQLKAEYLNGESIELSSIAHGTVV